MSLILTFLLLFTTIAGMGITTASAKTYSGLSVNIYKLQPGDSVEKGVKLYKKSFLEIQFLLLLLNKFYLHQEAHKSE